jgi:hypothetical protein
MPWDARFSRYTSPSNGVTHFPAVLFVTTVHKRLVRCTQDTQCTAGLSCDRMITEYTHDEYCDMLLTLGACNSRAGTAAREYALRYPGRRHPDANVFRRLEQCLRETGSVTSTALVNVGRPRTVRPPANEDAITAAVEREPWRSSRDIARELGLSQPRVLEVLHDDQLHPYHYSRGAHLFPDDRFLRMQFCEWLRHQHAADELFWHNILWTDEACFTR